MFQQINQNTYKITVITLFSALLFFVLVFMVQGSIKSSNNTTPLVIQHLLPQHWAFFTTDPKLERYYFYELSDGKIQAIELRHNVAATYFGLSRHNRVKLLLEADKLARQIEKWHSSSDSIPTINIWNNTRIGFMRGQYLVKKVMPPKWEDRAQQPNISYTKINVQL